MSWLTSSWYGILAAPWIYVALAGIAVLCGLIVGGEREKKEKPAGLRMMTLVCLGSATFTMVSFAISGEHGERARIAAGVVTGVGFLGAGAILRGPVGVSGLTTSATIWAVAAVGLVTGAGYVGAALGVSALMLAVLNGVSVLERRMLGACRFSTADVVFDLSGGKTALRIDGVLDEDHVPRSRRAFSEREGVGHLRLTYCGVHRAHRDPVIRLAELAEVREIHVEQPAT